MALRSRNPSATRPRDKSRSAQGVDIEALIDKVCAFDPHVGASLRLIRAFGLRRKESMLLRPNACIVPFESTGLPEKRSLSAVGRSESQLTELEWALARAMRWDALIPG